MNATLKEIQTRVHLYGGSSVTPQAMPFDYQSAKALLDEIIAMEEVVKAARPFLTLEGSRSACADAFYISLDGGKTGIGQHLKQAFKTLTALRKQKKAPIEPTTDPIEYAAVEFGFRCCEKGMNLEATMMELAKVKSGRLS